MSAWVTMKATSTRPSEMMGLEGVVAYAVDRAVVHWGSSFEGALDRAARGAKDAKAAEKAQDRVIRQWLPSQRQYADPNRR